MPMIEMGREFVCQTAAIKGLSTVYTFNFKRCPLTAGNSRVMEVDGSDDVP